MKGLGARLRRTLDGPEAARPRAPEGAPDAASHPTQATTISGALDRLRLRQGRFCALVEATDPPPPLDEVLPGSLVPTAAGPLYLVEERLPLSAHHGSYPLGGLFAAPLAHLQALTGDPRLAGFEPRHALFIDIEATGLDHGAGTVAFLIGVAFHDGEQLTLRQLVLRDHSDERAQLLYLRDLLEAFPFLISFNGKSYDLSVLQSRLVMHGLYTGPVAALKLKPHLDLLHLSRNLYRGLWGDTRLATLERELLGLERVDDLPGHLVPPCWLAWLRRHDPRPLAAVARHNRLDLLSMVTLAARLAAVSRPGRAPRTPLLALNLGRLLYRRRAFEQALEVLAGVALPEAHWLRAACARRLGDPRGREASLRALLALDPDHVAGLTELAVVLERRRELEQALELAARAAQRDDSESLRRRIARLSRRLRRAHGAGRGSPAPRPTPIAAD